MSEGSTVELENSLWVKKAIDWRSRHKEHVDMLASNSHMSFEPSAEDRNHPELWKMQSWAWLKEMEAKHSSEL